MLGSTQSTPRAAELAVPAGTELDRVRQEFSRRHCVVLRGLLPNPTATEIARRVESADFYRLEHKGIGVEASMNANATLAWLLLMVNDNRMRAAVETISGSGPLGHFDGRVYRLEPSSEHFDSWHSDLVDDRRVAMSINLGTEAYEGGSLEIRDRRTGTTTEARNAEVGDALLFELGEHLEHRVLPVTGDTPRTVFAGWFKGGAELPLGSGFGPEFDVRPRRPGDGGTHRHSDKGRGRDAMEGEQLRPSKGVVSRRVGGEVVLVQLERDKMYSLNRTGARAWELLDEGQDVGTVEVTLADEFGVDRTEVRSELESLIASLEQEGLLERG
jgi:Coenzyme PQQ synthesis protein D (PqqD)/2OG-Fe(II) oxygenase superfamily